MLRVKRSSKLITLKEHDELNKLPASKLPIPRTLKHILCTPEYYVKLDDLTFKQCAAYSDFYIAVTNGKYVTGYVNDNTFKNLITYYEGFMASISKSSMPLKASFKQGKVHRFLEKNRYFSYHNRPYITESSLTTLHKSGEYIITNGHKVVGYLIRGEHFNMWSLD